VNVGGTFDNQRVTGQASVDRATVSIYLGDQRVMLSNLHGSILFNSQQAQIDRPLEGTIEGGHFSVTGGAQLDGFDVSPVPLQHQRHRA
jgi:autotransporter translocation and assembly factor TamB